MSLRRVTCCHRPQIFRKTAVSKIDRLRLKKEARILRQVQHPAVPRLLDFAERAESSELFMERMPGVALSRVLQKGQSVPNACLEQIGDAIRHFHDLGWNHADIKPANILINESDAYLVDLNAAAPLGKKYRELRERSFSPSFASWKQLTGRGTVSEKDDEFSLELTRFLTSALRHPFGGQSVAAFFSLDPNDIRLTAESFGRRFRDCVLEQYNDFESEIQEMRSLN